VSLDVHLIAPGVEPEGVSEKIYIRRDGRTVRVTREEFAQIYGPEVEPVAVRVDPEALTGEVYWANITHNLGTMAAHAGLYEALWRPEEIGATRGRDLIQPLRDGLAVLNSERERLEQFNPGNGWGDYEGLRRFTADYLAACERWPHAEVRVSR
jgi:hypothetical protein